MTAPVPIQCHVRTSKQCHEKSTQRRIHQSQPWRGSCLVDNVSSGFLYSYPYILSLFLSFLFSPNLSFSLLSCSSSRRLRRHACRGSRWAGLACQNLPDVAVLPAGRCKSRRSMMKGWEGSHGKGRRGASRYEAGLDGKTGGGWTVFGCL